MPERRGAQTAGVAMSLGKYISVQSFVRNGVSYYQEMFLSSWVEVATDAHHLFCGTLAYDWHRLVDDVRD